MITDIWPMLERHELIIMNIQWKGYGSGINFLKMNENDKMLFKLCSYRNCDDCIAKGKVRRQAIFR